MCTVDSNFGKYYSESELMESETDITTKLAGMIRKAIDAFGK